MNDDCSCGFFGTNIDYSYMGFTGLDAVII